MKPKQIIVFDGLRITTEHLDHLQGAFLTGLHDLREAAGLGKVIRGFEVVPQGNNQILVQPGLAFDWQGNRIINDEPKTLDVAFRESQDSLWVTVRYDQLENGETEGKNTFVWDSCALDWSAEAPGPQEPAIAIARLDRAGDGALLVHPPDVGAPPALTEGQGGSVPASDGSPEEGGQPPNGSVGSQAKGTGANGGPKPPETRQVAQLAVGQGVSRLSSQPNPFVSPLKSMAAVVRAQSQPVEAGSPDPALTLAAADIDVPFSPVSLSCQAVLSASVTTGQGNDGTTSGPARLYACAWCEASQMKETVAQHALVYGGGGYTLPVPLLIEGVVAQLTLSAWAETGPQFGAAALETLPELAVCRYLQIAVRVSRRDLQGLQFVFTLEWKGGYAEDRIRLLESSTYHFEMEALVAWKAIGSV